METTLRIGQYLTVDHDIIDISGQIIMEEGQKVVIRQINITPAKWSNVFSMFMPEKINSICLYQIYGCWLLSAFTETKSLTTAYQHSLRKP